jgi:nicotinamidase-related amidase
MGIVRVLGCCQVRFGWSVDAEVPCSSGGVAWRPGGPELNLTAPLFARAPDRSVEGTWGAEFYEPVAPASGEVVVYKRGVSALAGTELDRRMGR